MSANQPLDLAVEEARAAQAAGDIERVIEIVDDAIRSGSLDTATAVLAALRPADRVDVFKRLAMDRRSLVIGELTDEQAADLLEELEDEDAAEVAGAMVPEALATILDIMEPDEAADVLGDLSPEHAESALRAMDDTAEAEARSLMAFSDESAGGRMTSAFLAFYTTETIAHATARLRKIAPTAEVVYYLYAVDEGERLRGVVSLRQLVVAEPTDSIGDAMDEDVIRVRADEDQETAARLMARYDLMALPVVDDAGRLVGVITHDDLVDVLEEEATEDMYLMVGLDETERSVDPVATSVRRRLPWLVLNLGTYVIPVLTLKTFQPTLQAVPTLAVLFPIVTNQGGNVGVQTLTFVVRSLALGEVSAGSEARLLLKEMLTGLINGVAIGMLSGLIAWAVARDTYEAVTIALTMTIAVAMNLAAGGLVGVLIPLGFRRLGLDPAAASSVFVTTATDTLGVLFFLGLAHLLLVTP